MLLKTPRRQSLVDELRGVFLPILLAVREAFTIFEL